jgi:hypothetical protein
MAHLDLLTIALEVVPTDYFGESWNEASRFAYGK